MQDQVNATPTPLKRVPWNEGKVAGATPPLRPKQVWSIRTNSKSKGVLGTSPCSIWRSTASCVAVTSSPSSETCAMSRHDGLVIWTPLDAV